jgi:uncharacterized RDD family membrane protein YckC
MPGQPEPTSTTGSIVTARTASFWRRLFAFIIDLALIGALEKLVGLAPLAAMSDAGAPRRLIGWGLVLAYFAGFDSTLGSGRSIGKRLLGICVVRADNTYLSPPAAALRAALLTAPFFASTDADSLIIEALLNVVGGGLLIAMIYLLALSNDTRQVLLHDLALGTLVVRQEDRKLGRPLPTVAPLHRVHLVAVGLILLASLLLPLVGLRFG